MTVGCLAGLTPTIGSAAELVMVEEPGCPWCARWNAEIGPTYPKTPEGRAAPLRRIDITERSPDDFSYARPVVFTPTFVLVDNGREVDRIEGYPGEELFWWRLAMLFQAHGLKEALTQ
ncbi:MAG: hypothetical protein ACWA5A_14275 [Marinibacterium sp.]